MIKVIEPYFIREWARSIIVWIIMLVSSCFILDNSEKYNINWVNFKGDG